MTDTQALVDALMESGAGIRYVAVALAGELVSRTREGLENTSDDNSDRYEVLIVNPTVLDLVQRRGNIDCGGARYVVIRYGNFWQLAMACRGGHVSIGIELDGDPLEVAAEASDVLLSHGL